MLRVIVAVALLAFTVYCVVDAIQTEDDQVRGLPKPMWVILVLLFPVAGGLGWLLAGRPTSIVESILGGPGPGPPRGPLGPDDDPDFLANLDWEQRKRHREQQRGDTSPDSEASGEATDPPAEGESPA